MEQFIGQILLVGFNWAPKGWATCEGQLMSIAQNTALFSLLGTTYGGDGRQTFGLPDLRGRVAVGQGTGPGLDPVIAGEMAGLGSVTLTASNLPSHVHPAAGGTLSTTVAIPVNDSGAMPTTPGNTMMLAAGADADGNAVYIYNNLAATTTLLPFPAAVSTGTTGPTGAGTPVPVTNPYLGSTYIIALEGIFPSRP